MGIWLLVAIGIVLIGLAVWIVVYILYIAVQIAVEAFANRRNRKFYPDQQTRLGRMAYEHPHWTMERMFEDRALRIYIDDADGQPDPKLLNYLTNHWAELGQFAATAQKAVAELTDHHRFESVGNSVNGDVCLGFTHDDADWAETVFVDMSGLEVVGSVTVD